jgi:hypothetical protein
MYVLALNPDQRRWRAHPAPSQRDEQWPPGSRTPSLAPVPGNFAGIEPACTGIPESTTTRPFGAYATRRQPTTADGW